MELERLHKALRACIVEAGHAILEVYDTNFTVESKTDDSPITEADRRAHAVIKDGLASVDVQGWQDLPFLSEEGVHTPYKARKTWKRFWLVDPLDGTKEFVNRNGEFTVNIALIEDGLPAAGWVYVPVSDVLYWGIVGKGAFKKEADGPAVPLRDTLSGARDAATKHEPLRPGPLTIVASRSHLNEETKRYIESVQKRTGRNAVTVQAGSSLKLCRIAEGSADLYPRFGPTMEWDTAAAHGVCLAAGCSVLDVSTGREMRYNKEDLHNHHFIAAPAETMHHYFSTDL